MALEKKLFRQQLTAAACLVPPPPHRAPVWYQDPKFSQRKNTFRYLRRELASVLCVPPSELSYFEAVYISAIRRRRRYGSHVTDSIQVLNAHCVYFRSAAGELDGLLQGFHAVVVAKCDEGVCCRLTHILESLLGFHLDVKPTRRGI